MRQELDDALVRDFPNLYIDRKRSMTETCMCWGFCCGDGWEPIIRDLSRELEKIIVNYPEGIQRPKAIQVKEKFGGLRFYITSGTEKMYKLICKAEKEAIKTCEFCGSKTNIKIRGDEWMKTLCEDCYKKEQ